jgi:hypothetical protein
MANNRYLDLSQYKAPGIYFEEYEGAPVTQVDTTILRLVPGFSRKGIYNKPILVNSKNEAIQIFGDIDPFLEKRGSFFHRSLFTALEAGPVLALALMPVNNGTDLDFPRDEVEYQSFSLDTKEKNSKVSSALYSAFFNKERFWELDLENFDGIIEFNATTSGKLLSVANLGTKQVSLITRKTNVKGFDITARKFFGQNNVPDYLQDFDILNDYFLEVIIIEGDWNDYEKLSIDPIYSKYFTKDGLIKSKLNDFLAEDGVDYVQNYTGSVIPDLIDGNGKNWSLDAIMNQGITITGLFTSINREVLENWENKADSVSDLDLVGHSLINQTASGSAVKELDFLSYKANFNTSKTYPSSENGEDLSTKVGNITLDGVTLQSKAIEGYGLLNNRLRIIKPTDATQLATYNTLKQAATEKTAVFAGHNDTTDTASEIYFGVVDAYEINEVNSLGDNEIVLYVDLKNSGKSAEADTVYTFDETDLDANSINLTSYTVYGAEVGRQIYFKPKTSASTGYYATISSLTLDDPGDECAIVVTGLPDTMTNLGIGNSTHDVVVSNLNPCQAINSGLTWTVRYSAAPNLTILDEAGTDYLEVYSGSDLYKDIESGLIKNGQVTGDTEYLKIEKAQDSVGIDIYNVKFFTNESLSINSATDAPAEDATFTTPFTTTDIVQTVPIVTNSLSADTKSVKITNANLGDTKVGDYIATSITEGLTTKYYAAKIISMVSNGDGTKTVTSAASITTFDVSSVDNVYILSAVEDFATNYTFATLSGFTVNDYHLPGNFLNRQSQLEKIIKVMGPGTNIYKALADNETMRFRYIVDTFSGGVSAECYPKNLITRLAKDKLRCLAIMNTPSWKELKESTDPRFSDLPSEVDPRPPIKVQYIKEGGNLSLGPSVRFSLPSEENGSRHCGFFGTYPLVRYNKKNIAVPPAAGISNRFVSKHFDGTKFNAVAGKYGGFSVTGATGALEHDFTFEDREFLAELGWNPIVWRENQGYVIFDNLMAYQEQLSAFNYLSTRDLLITIEDGIDSILQSYLWDNNTDFLREEVSARLRAFLNQVKVAGGLTDYKVTMTSANNTNETITAGFGIIDIDVEPTFPISKYLNRITVHNAGGVGELQQSGFSG